jgi:transcriptional regulator with XRE-family HTH domain
VVAQPHRCGYAEHVVFEPFASTLRQLLNARALSGAELGRQLDTDKSQVSRWKSGLARPEPETVTRIADLFGVDRVGLLELAGYLSGEPPPISAKRQAIRDQLDRWMAAVGADYEDDFWDALKAHGDSTVALITTVGTAVNAAAIAPLSTGVNTRNPARTTPRRGTGRRLRPAQRCAKPQLTPRRPHPGYPQTPLRPPLHRLTPLHS